MQTLVYLGTQILTFYLPVFYTFKFLNNQNHEKIRVILKFWVVLSIYYPLQLILSKIISESIFPFISLVCLFGLNYNEYRYSEMIFNMVISSLYAQNRQNIEKISNNIEKIFNKNSTKLKDKVTTSATDKFRDFIGEMVVGALNPHNKAKKSEGENNNDEDQDKDD